MKKVLVYHYDAFCNVPNKGNPAGIVIGDGYLTDNQISSSIKGNAAIFHSSILFRDN